MSEQPVVSVAVMGQGYVGLPLAMRAAQVGYCVTGFEPDPARLARLIEGDSYIENASAGKNGTGRLSTKLGLAPVPPDVLAE